MLVSDNDERRPCKLFSLFKGFIFYLLCLQLFCEASFNSLFFFAMHSSDQNTYMTAETISHQPPLPPRQPGVEVPWSSGLCDCFSDVSNCCLTCWCPGITFGRIAEIVDEGSSSCGANAALYTLINIVTGCACIYSCVYRGKMRQQYAIKEGPCWDCCVHCFCEHCALCQEYRELQNRGYNMTNGWQGNVEEKNREVAMVPPTEAGMTR